MKKFISLVLAGVLLAGCLTGCGGSGGDSAADASTDTAETTEETSEESTTTGEKILRVASEDPQVPLDMQLNTYGLIMKITDNVTESLLYTNPEGVLEPTLLAEMPTLSDDKLTYSFTLLEGVKFHNGATLTSNDVKYSLERMVSKYKMSSLLEKVAGYQEFFDEEADEITGIEIVDDTHFNIHMSEVYTPLLSALSTPYCAIYPAEACEEAGDDWGVTVLYGTGPFKLVSYQTGVGVELARYDDFRGDKAKLDGIKYTFIDEPSTGVLEYQKGNVDMLYLDASLYPTYSTGDLADELYSFNPIGGYYVSFNVKDVPEVKVREALTYAIDRDAICNSVLFGTATPNSNFLQEGLVGADSSSVQFTYDPEKAKELLAEAGYADGYDLRLTVNTKYPTSAKIATAIQAQAAEAGFNIEVEQVDSAAWTDMKKSGGITSAVCNWYVDYVDPDSMLYPVSDGRVDMNSIFWHNDEFKQLMIDGVQTEDTDERQEIYARADEILTHEQFAVAMIYNETMFYLLKPYVKDFEVTFTYRTMFANTDIEQ